METTYVPKKEGTMDSIIIIIIIIIFYENLRNILGAIAKLRKATISFVMSVRPHGTIRLPLHEFS